MFLVISIVMVTAFIVPMADFHGRKFLNIVLGLILALSISMLALSVSIVKLQNLKLVTFLICISIGVSSARAIVSLIYTNELFPRSYLTNIISFGFAMIAVKVLVNVAHMQLTNVSYVVSLYVMIGFNVLTLPLLAKVLPESPYFLYTTGQSFEFFSALIKLHQINRCVIDDNVKLDVTALALKDPKKETLDQ